MTSVHARGGKLDDDGIRLLLAVVQELYASAMDGTSEIWGKIYAQGSRLLMSEAGGFISTDKVNQALDVASLIGFDQARAIRAYQELGVETDVLFMGILHMTAGSTFLGTETIGLRAMQRSPFYGILSEPLDLRYVCGGILENDGKHHSALYFWRRKDQPDFDQDSQTQLATLLPHIRQALEVQRRIRGPQLQGTPVGALSLDNFRDSRHGMLVLDDKGKVLFANLEAERIARSASGISMRGGLFRLEDPQFASDLERMMSRALGISRRAEFGQIRPIRIPQGAGRQAYEVFLIPVTDGAQRAMLPASAAFMVVISDPDVVAAASHQRLREYGLTSAEARLCQALVRTGSLPDAANELHISQSTARSHLKNIFTKLGVTSQVKLVMRLAAAQPVPLW